MAAAARKIPLPEVETDPLPEVEADELPIGNESLPEVQEDNEQPIVSKKQKALKICHKSLRWCRKNYISAIFYTLVAAIACRAITNDLVAVFTPDQIDYNWEHGQWVAKTYNPKAEQLEDFKRACIACIVFYFIASYNLKNTKALSITLAIPFAACATCCIGFVAWSILFSRTPDYVFVVAATVLALLLSGVCKLFLNTSNSLISYSSAENQTTTIAHSKWADTRSPQFRNITED